jgi:hypothetical protein
MLEQVYLISQTSNKKSNNGEKVFSSVLYGWNESEENPHLSNSLMNRSNISTLLSVAASVG